MRRTGPLLLGLLAGLATSATAQGTSVPWARPPGKHAVGFDLLFAADSGRPDADSAPPKPLQIALWYPTAAAAGGMPLTYGEYVALAAEQHPADSAAGQRAEEEYRASLVSRGVPDRVVDTWFRSPLGALRDAAPSAGSFPLVLLAQGEDQKAHDQAVLAEYVASQGYVVATTQAEDLRGALAALAARPEIRTRRIGVIAHAFGSEGALLFASEEPRVRALVSLDGAIGSAARQQALEAGQSLRPAEMSAAILHVYQMLDSLAPPDFELLRSLTSSPRWIVGPVALRHQHFTTLGAAVGAFPDLATATGAEEGSTQVYAGVAQITVEFLDAFVKWSGSARARVLGDRRWPEGHRVTRIRSTTRRPAALSR